MVERLSVHLLTVLLQINLVLEGRISVSRIRQKIAIIIRNNMET